MIEEGKYNAKGQYFIQGDHDMIVDTRPDEENKYQFYGEENILSNQIESGRIPQ